MKRLFALLTAFFLCIGLSAQQPSLHIITTGDVHGSWFDKPYVDGGKLKTSLMSVKHYVDSVRNAAGSDNVLLLDAGDCLQGDNAPYYFNYVVPGEPHLFPRIASYMGYDAIVVGNHDIETGHEVYDKVFSELGEKGIPWLAGNYIRDADGTPYFPLYHVFHKAGKKILVMGFGNPNIKSWLSEHAWKGMHFESIVPFAQECLDRVLPLEKPDFTIVIMHSGTGDGDGKSLESQGLDLLASVRGADLLVSGHDHIPTVVSRDGVILMDGGARAGYVGHAVLDGSGLHAETVRLDKKLADEAMEEKFRKEFDAVREFTNHNVGELSVPLYTRDAYAGMCDYLNLIHTVQLSVPEADISFAAPLTFNGTVREGTVVYNDMFTIYPFENQLFVIRMTGDEIRRYLEYSYYTWINPGREHVLRIEKKADARTSSEKWSFSGRTYNFDSAGGIRYTVDVRKPVGKRIRIISMADGSDFNPDTLYNVALTSYRANGGGELLAKGAGIDNEEMQKRLIAVYPAIRDLVYDYFRKHSIITPQLIGNTGLIGEWKFIPSDKSGRMIRDDLELVF